MPYVVLQSDAPDSLEAYLFTNDERVLDYYGLRESAIIKETPLQVLDNLEKLGFKVVAMTGTTTTAPFMNLYWTLHQS